MSGIWDAIQSGVDWLTNKDNAGAIGGGIGTIAALAGLSESNNQATGYQGSVPFYEFNRDQVPYDYQNETRGPGSFGRRYFSDAVYSLPEGMSAADAGVPAGISMPSFDAAQGLVADQANALAANYYANNPAMSNVPDIKSISGTGGTGVVPTASQVNQNASQEEIDAFIQTLEELYGAGVFTGSGGSGGGSTGGGSGGGSTGGGSTGGGSTGGGSTGGGSTGGGSTGGGSTGGGSTGGGGSGSVDYGDATGNIFVPSFCQSGWEDENGVCYPVGVTPFSGGNNNSGTNNTDNNTNTNNTNNTSNTNNTNSGGNPEDAIRDLGFFDLGSIYGNVGYWVGITQNGGPGAAIQAYNAGNFDLPQLAYILEQSGLDPQTFNVPPSGYAYGGMVKGYAGGGYLGGISDGMGDMVPANIDGQQPAALSDGEFVVPADVVSHLGNGNSNAGARELYDMMDRIRLARTGTEKQGKQVDASSYMPR